ncbi:MAG TPA: CHASE sensor domain-containing protein, partial [Thermoanaerobaculia bacterium]|nr:CHASE sensor domain-containing protein [Thermoanaerobaculia bacterium]
MRHRLAHLSIPRQLTAITMATCSAALLLACAAFVLHDVVSFRRLLVRQVSTLAEIVGANSGAAILAGDAAAARAHLAALAAEEDLHWAALYTADGRLLARWARPGAGRAGP